MEGLAALMTKLLSSMGDMEARMEARLTLLESRFAAAFPSFTAPSPVPPQQHGEGILYGGVDGTQRRCRLQRAAGIQSSLQQ